MNRIKSFDATGIAPNGRLFAGDLNAIQDAAAALADLTQNIQVGTLTVGEVGLQIVRFGAGEGRITGAFRVDGILRGLSGVYAGQYTTTQRDAIAAGSRPNGLLIFNTTTAKLEFNGGTDAAPAWQPVGVSILAQAGVPSGASAANANTFYLRTDLGGGTLYYSTGAAWVQMAHSVNIVAGEVTDAMLAGSITPSKITGTAVVTADSRLSDQRTPLDLSVTTAKLVDGSVTTAKILDGTILGSDINTGTTITAAGLASSGNVTATANVIGGAVYSGAGANQLLVHRTPYGNHRHICVGSVSMPADIGSGSSASASFDRVFTASPIVTTGANANVRAGVNFPSTTGMSVFSGDGYGVYTLFYHAEGSS